MTTLSCLALILYMEARSEPVITQQLVASVALERAKNEKLELCSSIKKPKAYTWMWDGINTPVDKTSKEYTKALKLARQALARQTLAGRLYFNNCTLGRRWKTSYKVIRSGKLCFY